jgi:putative N6-adenine-specific DNA methylase
VKVAEGTPAIDDTESVDDDGPEKGQLFVVRIFNDTCTISADSSGELLHRRGYRQAVAKAPLRETLAAAMIMGSEWDPATPLVDPMCGSGTIPIEAAMIARDMAPGLDRSFAFEQWPDHDSTAWDRLKDVARERVKAGTRAPIVASDRDPGAVTATRSNAERAGVSADIEIAERAISDVGYPDQDGLVITNPPYGQRVGEPGALRNLYSQLGKIARGPAKGYRVALLSADRSLEAATRLDFTEIFRTTNGGIPVRLIISGVLAPGSLNWR